jgi:hypothetical protein
MPTVQTAERIVAPPDTPAADILDAAAALILACGHTTDDFWTGADLQDWRPSLPLSLAGAVAVARGHITYRDVVAAWSRGVDPAIEALARHIGWRGPIEAALPGLWAWEARTPGVHVAVALTRCAADLRAAVTCLSCGHAYPGHYPSCEFQTVTS